MLTADSSVKFNSLMLFCCTAQWHFECTFLDASLTCNALAYSLSKCFSKEQYYYKILCDRVLRTTRVNSKGSRACSTLGLDLMPDRGVAAFSSGCLPHTVTSSLGALAWRGTHRRWPKASRCACPVNI